MTTSLTSLLLPEYACGLGHAELHSQWIKWKGLDHDSRAD